MVKLEEENRIGIGCVFSGGFFNDLWWWWFYKLLFFLIVGAKVVVPFISLENQHVPVKEHIPGLISGSLF